MLDRSRAALFTQLLLLPVLGAGCADPSSPQPDASESAGPDAEADAAGADASRADAGGDAGELHPDIVRVIEVPGRDPGNGWSDSYSVGDECYCESTFDHNIGDVLVDTPAGPRTVRQVCDAIGPGPGSEGRPVYNDIQCGNGPANDAGDEDDCPGRVDIGRNGCGHIGPLWDLSSVP